ncbi:uncharacterized protein [Branchiostoma lanceolatum]|uniref:uncharacterized protein isoform X2 n=1 Tax=Branchiostoma lanceolatum TaxID=7740 RepID=UPI00345721EF
MIPVEKSIYGCFLSPFFIASFRNLQTQVRNLLTDFKRGEGLEEEERSLQDELDQKLDARELEGLEEEVRSLLDGLKEKLDARELEGLEEDYARRRR